MKKKVLVFVLLVMFVISITSCISTRSKIDPDILSLIIKGKTTESEVIELFGEPESKTTNPDGTKIYSYIHTWYTYASIWSGSRKTVFLNTETITVMFDDKGFVTNLTRDEELNK